MSPTSPIPVPRRRDQVQCPNCGHFGCPTHGTHKRNGKLTNYRRCPACGTSFQTVKTRGKPRLDYIQPTVPVSKVGTCPTCGRPVHAS